ncbi:hypothetical protein UlMin_008278 [Ulmus minor]
MKLNPAKCAFGVASGKFLGFMVHQRGIEANPEKIQALLDMRSPVKIRDVQSLTALLTGLKMARELDVKAIHVFCDSKLVSAQINTEFQAREPRMAAYLQLAQNEISCFESFEITHIPWAENSEADRLARIGSGIDRSSGHHVDILCSPSTDGASINQIDEGPTWMTPIVGYLLRGELPQDKVEARTLRMRAARYTCLAGQLYKRGFSNPLLKCVTADQGSYIMREIHEGVCGNHAGKRSLLHKIVRQGYYWPSMAKDAE